jgi:hypothetical protein
MSTDPMTLHVTFNNLQRDLEALEARHLDLARRYDALLAQDRAERHACREQFSIIANYLLGQGEGEGRDPDECRALATNEALAAFDRLDAQDGTP